MSLVEIEPVVFTTILVPAGMVPALTNPAEKSERVKTAVSRKRYVRVMNYLDKQFPFGPNSYQETLVLLGLACRTEGGVEARVISEIQEAAVRKPGRCFASVTGNRRGRAVACPSAVQALGRTTCAWGASRD